MTEERERRRMATYLHDVIGQTLALCKLKVRGIQKFDAVHAAEVHLDELRELIEQSIHQTQELTFELCPPILYELSFESALEWLTERLERQHGISFAFESDKEPKRLTMEMKVVLFQYVREILMNAIKHAEARHISVAIAREESRIKIDIVDDGIGFDTTTDTRKTKSGGGFGIFNVRERLSHLGGTLSISSTQNHGTRVVIVAPMNEETPESPAIPAPVVFANTTQMDRKDSQ